MSFRCGIVGAPNVGKSTLFNALTSSHVPAENYPFCTIDANVGIVAVPDDRLEIISRIVKVREKVPATLEFVDIAGLVEGASQGEGLGNRFLANIREMDVIAYVASAFGSDDSIDVQAVTDQFDMLKTELMIADLDTVRNSFDKSVRRASTGDKEQKRVLGAIKRAGLAIEKGIEVKDVDLTGQEREDLRDLFLLTAKPAFHIVNIGENQLATGTGDLEQAVGNSIVAVCAKIEAELADLDEEDRDSFRDTLGIKRSALDSIIRTGYSVLGLKTFFTFNETETRAWTITQGSTAQQAAGKIHTDMATGFVRAEVFKFEDLAAIGDEQKIRNLGKVRYEGKSYEVQEGDILRIRFK